MTITETNESARKSCILPSAGEQVIVHCLGFSCLGYLDKNGNWKSVFTNEILPDVIDFSPIS